jgi:hypothetical protein
MSFLLSNPLLIAVSILGVITIILLVITIMMNIKLRKFLIDKDGDNIGDSLQFAAENIKDLQAFKAELESYLTTVENRLKKSVQAVHTVRFNPFKGEGGGGNQSFATAFLTEDGDGVVISSLYSRDHVSIFGKPVKKHSSEFELSGEEKEALAKARERLK